VVYLHSATRQTADEPGDGSENMERRYKDAEEAEGALVAEINRLLDAIALHRREHIGGQYSDRDRKLYASIGFTPPAPVSRQPNEIRKPR